MALAFAATGASADTSTAAEIALLKAQLRRLEAKVAAQERRKRTPQQDAVAPAAGRKQAVPGTAVAGVAPKQRATGAQVYGDGPMPQFVACPEKSLCYKGVTFTPGGFVALETVTRQHNLSSDVGSPFGAIEVAPQEATPSVGTRSRGSTSDRANRT